MTAPYTTQHEQAVLFLADMMAAGKFNEMLARFWWYAYYRRHCMAIIAGEIEGLAKDYLEEWRAYRARWPWETDVLDRMANDRLARVVTVDYIRPQPPPRVSLK